MKKLQNDALNRLSVSEHQVADKLPVRIILDRVRSALNVGSVFRTADAFRLEAIYCCGITAVPPHKEILKTALGATETVKWEHHETTIDAILRARGDGYRIIGIEQTDQSISLPDVETTGQPLALVFGHEVEGVHIDALKLCDEVWEIPQAGSKHSLNISVAAGIVAWEVFRQNHQILSGSK
ncbi:MAG: RNA methyltransferase [Flavobacteriales bacterium]|nr:RNA methyltransferase [Flavobacteriales bacterium]MCB9447006.1 RNA methyltransferase [Flavobacteriales bacterium]